ncbi:MAG: threonine/serine exporter family protein [Eubacteriales bacterium]|nr:threonine/serine exporter family protein [Eubacteriales bacterium]
MNREEAEQYLYCAMSIGEQLLVSGAEVGRVEDTIRRICMAYGAVRVDVFSITSSIVTTMYEKDAQTYTQTRRVSAMANDLHKLDELNRLSRKICETRPEPDQIKTELDKIMKGPRYTFTQQLLIYALISGSFSVFFGGDWKDMLSSAVIGILLKFFEAFVKRMSVNGLITALLCASVGGFLANLAVLCRLGNHADLISIGNIMLFIPGLAFTNSLRDMFSGDTITGLIRFMDSILLAIIIALGFTFANFLF